MGRDLSTQSTSEDETTVAVVGGGIFGTTAAIRLAAADYEVDLFEKADDILSATSWSNQFRLHRGYHYPRSTLTAKQCRDAERAFADEYADAVVETGTHYYCIARERTKTKGEEFVDFCDDVGLEYEYETPAVVEASKLDTSVRVREHRIDPFRLGELCRTRLDRFGVDVHLGRRVDDVDSLDHDYVVVATYAHLNPVLGADSSVRREYKFELCEKPVVELPSAFAETSVVVMDGPFMCVDPYGRTDRFLLDNVVHAVHERSVGLRPEFDPEYERLLNSGVIRDPELTAFDSFVEHGSEFFPDLPEADHVGSMYTVRTVLPDVEETDARPTLVEQDADVFVLFSGKIPNCVTAADELLRRIRADR